jgi:MFS family permease
LLWWGKLADRIGNRLILLLVGMVVAVTPVFWLLASSDRISLWVWLPLLHLLGGGTWAAIDLCSNNIQMDVVPARHQASYFAIAAAVAGVAGAIATTAPGFLAQFADYGGLPGLFVLSGVLRLVALIPLIFIRERCSQPFSHLMQLLHQKMRSLFAPRWQPVPVPTADLRNRSK